MDINKPTERTSIFRSLFVPMIFIMILQAMIFYAAAVYGGIEESLSQNAVDILSERLYNRKNEIETRFNNRWSALDDCVSTLDKQYALYEKEHGDKPLVRDTQLQIDFLAQSADKLIDTLRYSEANGIFLILNDTAAQHADFPEDGAQKYGLCIRDMDQDSNYSGTEDLLLERAPSSIIDALGCSLDSWWEARYSFESEADGAFFYAPLNAAWKRLSAESEDLAYFSDVHQISGSDPKMVSYSIPLLSADGFPYGVLGTELSAKYLSSLLPNKELNEADKCCYVLALQDDGAPSYKPIVGTGALYSRCFGDEPAITRKGEASTGGFTVMGRDGSVLYATAAKLDIYNNNSPFETRRLVLLAMVERDTLFSYIGRIKTTLMAVSFLSLLLGIFGLAVVSKRFARPITALAQRVRGMNVDKSDYRLGRLGITEIDQLVDSIEELNRNVSRNSARTEFFSRMSHDMRTPMNAIISFSSPEMLEGADEAVKNDYLNKIHASGMYLLALINEVLDMTKIENNKTELHIAAARAAGLFDTTIPIIEKLAQQKGVVFSADVRIDSALWVMADGQHINQIVMNLLSNAVKFTPANGAVRLFAKLAEDEAGKLCRIVVSDTGIGMSETFLKSLYTPFEQENGSHEGTGLGLSIAKRLVELMHGTIECTSRQNVGTTFTITLPLPLADAPASAALQSGAPRADITALKGKRVLICEDNAVNTMIIRQLLERVGLIVDAAENGQIGVELFSLSPPWAYSAIFMDIRMPIMNGLAATEAIRAMQREDAAHIPIIAMTANAFEEDAQSSRAAGMNEHLSKPVEPQKLYDTLLQYIV